MLMESFKITTHSAKETQKVACLFAQEIVKSDFNRKNALVVALDGNLGGGKTTFAQGFAKGLGVREKVLSPTFVIMRHHLLINNRRIFHFRRFVHIDAYRLKSTQELHPLGWQDILKDKDAIVLVEWEDRIRRALPKEYIRVQFEFLSERERKIIIQNVYQHKRKKE